jgi:hypothetical protein
MFADAVVQFIERTSLALSGHGRAAPRIEAAGVAAGQRVATTVDSEAARYYLERKGLPSYPDQKLYARIDALQPVSDPLTISREYLAQMAKAFSPDVAALHLAEHLFGNEINRRFQSALQQQFTRLKALSAKGSSAPLPTERYLALFVPGMHYRSFPQTGADFAKPRQILTQMGLDNALLETAENGTVEENARLVADDISKRSRGSADVILVSASKSGPEIAQALGETLSAHETAHIKAWINIGGLLQGTYLADWALRWPKRWFVQLLFAFKGWDLESGRSLMTARSRERFCRWHIPGHILVINYVGIPLSGHITKRATNNYLDLRMHGPNDGLSLLSDELVPDAITIVECGLDHYYISPEMDMKAAALAYTVINQLDVSSSVQELG